MRGNRNVSLRSITYVHDPDAASTWFSICVELMKFELIRRAKDHMLKEKTDEVVSWFEKKL